MPAGSFGFFSCSSLLAILGTEPPGPGTCYLSALPLSDTACPCILLGKQHFSTEKEKTVLNMNLNTIILIQSTQTCFRTKGHRKQRKARLHHRYHQPFFLQPTVSLLGARNGTTSGLHSTSPRRQSQWAP